MSISKFFTASSRLASDDKGVTAVEYAVLGALIIVACVTAIGLMSTALQGTFARITAIL